MCTILLARRCHADFPLVVAANRDEFFAREATAPEVLHRQPAVAIGGRDLRQGGTWLGATAAGLFVGLTNQRTYQPPDTERRSRGEVVRDALRCSSVGDITRLLLSLDARELNPFNLIYGTADELRVAYARTSARVEIADVPEGLHVLPNDRLDSPEFGPKVARAKELARGLGDTSWPQLVALLTKVLSDHSLPPEELVPEPPATSMMSRSLARQLLALCIHTPVYGTCSATILALKQSRVAHYLFAAGPPCESPFEDVTSLIEQSAYSCPEKPEN